MTLSYYFLLMNNLEKNTNDCCVPLWLCFFSVSYKQIAFLHLAQGQYFHTLLMLTGDWIIMLRCNIHFRVIEVCQNVMNRDCRVCVILLEKVKSCTVLSSSWFHAFTNNLS